ncbi:MAG: hypothetical protein ACLFUB_12355 [Cyclobacteriaceae bacterium]
MDDIVLKKTYGAISLQSASNQPEISLPAVPQKTLDYLVHYPDECVKLMTIILLIMQAPTNMNQRIEAITKLVKKLSADEQKALYRELSKAENLELAEKIKNSVKQSGQKSLSMAEIVAECKAARKKINERKKDSH